MRQNGSIQMQDPSASPTFALSRSSNNADVPPSLRRNLFGSHLSRRPVVPPPHAPIDQNPDPFLATESPSHTNRHAQPNIYHQSPSHNQHAMNVHNGYEPRRSPSRSLSPAKMQHYTTSAASIIAVDPSTGRALLPVMPQLPSRMREGSDDENEDDEDEEEVSDEDDPDADEHNRAWRRMKAFERANTHSTQHDMDSALHSSSIIGMQSQPPKPLLGLIDASPAGGDYNKIEKILTQMVSQQKDRARTAAIPESATASSFDTPTDLGGVSARTRGKFRAAVIENHDYSSSKQSSSQSTDRPRVGGVGATLDPKDKDELLGLIMTSLGKRVQQAEEEAWMFGDDRLAANGVSISGSYNYSGRDDEEY